MPERLIKGIPNPAPEVAYQTVSGLHGEKLPETIASTIMERKPKASGLLPRIAEAVWVRPPAAIMRAYRRIPESIRERWDGEGDRSTSHIALDGINRGEGLDSGWTVFARMAIPRHGMHPNPYEFSPQTHPGLWFEKPFN